MRTITAVLLLALGAPPAVSANDKPADLFATDDILHFTLSGDLRPLLADRKDSATYFPLTLTYALADGSPQALPLKVRTRGNFRRMKGNCTYPPLMLNFSKAGSKGTLFEGQDKLKLVMPCQGEQYVVREYLVYKLYNLVTEKSFRARLVRVRLQDTKRGKTTELYGILLEHEDAMAARNGVKVLERGMLRGEHTETETFLKMAVFQYMIGNTDWSVPYRHNIRIISFDSNTIASVVPYDFDHAGIVDAPYALPPEQLALRSTQERRYRGFCLTDMAAFGAVIATYNRLKDSIYKVYTDCPLLDARYVAATRRFLDEFYLTINNPGKAKTAFSHPCQKDQPSIVIKGLQE